MPIGNKDLQQCADAVMHLRAKYLFKNQLRGNIHFTLTNGFRADYGKWAEGYRITISGNKAQWERTALPDTSYATFCDYMEFIYTYCGTLSLSEELTQVNYEELQPGDVLIKGGAPGHAEIVMDVAQNRKGEKVYLLAQSYMPAQEIQVLANPQNKTLSPWYELRSNESKIVTPEWEFDSGQLKRFEDVAKARY